MARTAASSRPRARRTNSASPPAAAVVWGACAWRMADHFRSDQRRLTVGVPTSIVKVGNLFASGASNEQKLGGLYGGIPCQTPDRLHKSPDIQSIQWLFRFRSHVSF